VNQLNDEFPDYYLALRSRDRRTQQIGCETPFDRAIFLLRRFVVLDYGRYEVGILRLGR
jgi:hypothetical protein